MFKHWGEYFKKMGPAWIISAVACGPATLASVAVAGSTYGYQLLWVVILSAVFGTTAQYLAARIGIIEGRGIIATTQARLGSFWAWVLMVDAVTATLLAAVVLMNAVVGVTGLITGISSPFWGFAYAALFGLALIRGGYKWFENLCKLVVAFMVVCFGITAFMSDISLPAMASGLIPSFPADSGSALKIAAIMGGAVHITIIGMHTYNTNTRGWKKADLPLARFDTVISMGVAFCLYSLAIFLVAAAVLHPAGIKIKFASDAALSLGPLLGDAAMAIFLAGVWAATISTIMPTFLAGAYFICDKMNWPVDTRDKRFKTVIAVGLAISVLGPFVKGGFFLLLPVMLALGLCGTPLIIMLILYLLNKKEVAGELKNSAWLNILGFIALAITTVLAVRFIFS